MELSIKCDAEYTGGLTLPYDFAVKMPELEGLTLEEVQVDGTFTDALKVCSATNVTINNCDIQTIDLNEINCYRNTNAYRLTLDCCDIGDILNCYRRGMFYDITITGSIIKTRATFLSKMDDYLIRSNDRLSLMIESCGVNV